MKAVFTVLLLLSSVAICAEKPKANPADFTITVHVVRSRHDPSQHLNVVVDGMPAELRAVEAVGGLLALGDYKAQSIKSDFIPTRQNGYDVYRVYRFLLPDGSTRDYNVVGIGSK